MNTACVLDDVVVVILVTSHGSLITCSLLACFCVPVLLGSSWRRFIGSKSPASPQVCKMLSTAWSAPGDMVLLLQLLDILTGQFAAVFKDKIMNVSQFARLDHRWTWKRRSVRTFSGLVSLMFKSHRTVMRSYSFISLHPCSSKHIKLWGVYGPERTFLPWTKIFCVYRIS